MNERIFVIGGTRGTGLLITNLLLREGYRVRALVRDEAKAQQQLSSAVELVVGDITQPRTLAGTFKAMDHVIFTAGVTKRPASEHLVKATEYDGVTNTLAAARDAAFAGRFLYMTAIGVTRSSISASLLNLVKGNTLEWRKRAEGEIRKSGISYTVVRAGILVNRSGRGGAIEVSQNDYPLALKYKIGRADVAETFVQALKHPETQRTTFEVVWAKGAQREPWSVLFGRLKPDV
jgi:uncharacterized protein YbjT (DUF2867 family)